MHQTLFISDLHLEAEQPQTAELFLDFLQEQAIRADALYILGDFFEVWVGDDDLNAFNQSIMQGLKALTSKNVPVYFMPGNRDFLIGKKFAARTGCQLLADPTRINLYGIPTLLMHGDSLCTWDVKHQKFRRLANIKIYQKIFLSAPLFIRKILGKYIRNLSKRHTKNAASYQLDVTPEEVVQVMRQYGVDRLIHGHTHRPDIHPVIDNNKEIGKRVVLGAWHNNMGSVLICTPEGQMQLESIAEKT